MVGAWHWRGMGSVNQTRPHCVNQMGKRYSKPLAARRGNGTVWAPHAVCESAFTINHCGPGSSVGIATGYGPHGPGIESR